MIDRSKVWTGTVNEVALAGRAEAEGRLLRHDVARRRAGGRRHLRPGAEARDRQAHRRAGHRPHRGRLPARVRRGQGSDPADLQGRPEGGDLGIFPRPGRRRRRGGRARPEIHGDRGADLAPEARCTRGRARERDRAHPQGGRVRGEERHPRRLFRRRRDARRPRLPRARLQDGARRRREGAGDGRHDRHRHPGGGDASWSAR